MYCAHLRGGVMKAIPLSCYVVQELLTPLSVSSVASLTSQSKSDGYLFYRGGFFRRWLGFAERKRAKGLADKGGSGMDKNIMPQ